MADPHHQPPKYPCTRLATPFVHLQLAMQSLSIAVRETGQAMVRMGSYLQGVTPPKVRTIKALQNRALPSIHKTSFLATNASISGAATVGEGSAIGYGTVIRADVNSITVGKGSVVGDRVTIHAARDGLRQTGLKTYIGDGAYIGSGSLIHAAVVEDGATVLPGSTVLDGSVIGSGSILGPSSLLLGARHIPPGEYWEGSPAKFVRKLSTQESEEAQSLKNDALDLYKSHAETSESSIE